jgi:hypothetical protein
MSDGYQLAQKKISRNKLLINVFNDYNKLLNIEIEMKQNIKEFYETQQVLLMQVNELEEKQAVEFTSERRNEINNIMKTIGLYKEPQEILDLMKTAPEIKKQIDHNSDTIIRLQELIPESGLVTNYSIQASHSD